MCNFIDNIHEEKNNIRCTLYLSEIKMLICRKLFVELVNFNLLYYKETECKIDIFLNLK